MIDRELKALDEELRKERLADVEIAKEEGGLCAALDAGVVFGCDVFRCNKEHNIAPVPVCELCKIIRR